jgi:hypothetical protein
VCGHALSYHLPLPAVICYAGGKYSIICVMKDERCSVYEKM